MPYDNILVRRPEFDEFTAMAEIKVKGWQSAYNKIVDEAYLQKLSAEQICNIMRENKKKDRYLIAEAGGEIVGFCRYRLCEELDGQDNCRGIISELYVKLNRKRMGIGGLLFRYALDDLKESGCGSAELGCFSENHSALAFYRKMNGEFIGRECFDIEGRKYLVDCLRFELKK